MKWLIKWLCRCIIAPLRLGAEDVIIIEAEDLHIGRMWATYLHENVWPDHTILVRDKNVDVLTLRQASDKLKSKLRSALNG